MLERLSELHHGAANAALDGGERKGKFCGDLAVRETPKKGQLNGLADLRRQVIQRLPNGSCAFRMFRVAQGLGDRCGAIFGFCLRGFVEAEPAGGGANPVDRLVPGNRNRPGKRSPPTGS